MVSFAEDGSVIPPEVAALDLRNHRVAGPGKVEIEAGDGTKMYIPIGAIPRFSHLGVYNGCSYTPPP